MKKQIYFIDSKLNDYQAIINSLSSTDLYYIIDSSTAGLTQISNTLLNYSNLDSIHIYSHGDIGSLNIGNTIYDNTNISNYKIELENIGKSLSSTGDILLYGCNVGQDELGLNFINQIAQFTQADVASSNDLTGNRVLGGDWDLEVRSGIVETNVVGVEEYQGTLAVNTMPTFTAPNGKVITDFGKNGSINYINIQSNGEILAAGYSYDDINVDFIITKYNKDGILDNTFNSDGKIVINDGYVNDVFFQVDGKILVAKKSSEYAIIRFNTDGSSDNTFNKNGKLIIDYGYDITLQSDGKILVAGQSNHDFEIARYNSDGSLDSTFGEDGKVITNIEGEDLASNIIVQADGKILVAGFSNGSNYNFTMVRYNTDGSLDTTFNNNGKVITDIFMGYNHDYNITIQSDGKIIVTSSLYSYENWNYLFSSSRYNTDGSLDTTFDVDGKVSINFGVRSFATSAVVQSDGKILIAGSIGENQSDFIIVRYNTDGSLDYAFGLNGKVITDLGGTDYVNNISLQLDGKILVSGTSNGNFAIVRLNMDGSLDNTFSSPMNTLGEKSILCWEQDKIVLDSDAQIYDAELSALGNYNGASLTLSRHDLANSQDVFSSVFGGTLSNLTQGSYFSVDNITIGRVNTNSNGILKLTFNSNATQNLVNKAIQQITYENTSDAPPSSVQIDWTFNDGNTGSQGDGGVKSIVGSTTVYIKGINDSPYLSSYLKDLSIEIGKKLNYSIPINTFIDPDGDTLKYTITMADGTAVPPWISFNSITKTFTGTPTLDDVGSLSIKVTVTDPSGKSTYDFFNLFTYENHKPTITSSTTGTIAENSALSTVIYKTTATDADANTALKYSLSGIDASLLNINSSTGAVTLKSSANYEAKKSYSFNVIASDESLSSSKAVIVNVSNVNEFRPTSVNKTITMNEDSKRVLTLTDFAFSDADANSSLSKVKITQLETKGRLTLNGIDVTLNKEILASDIKAGKLVYASNANEFGISYANFKFQVNDGSLYSTNSYTTTFNVTNIADVKSSSVSYTLSEPDYVLTLTGTANINGTGNNLNNTITGNTAANILNGKSGNDTLYGGAGNDTLYGELGNDILNGQTGNDTMLGGAGNDIYYVDSALDKVYETKTTSSTSGDATGIDTVNSSIGYTLGLYLENLTLTRTANINGIGNNLNNTIIGNTAANILNGKSGNDTLYGGAGNDTLYGELGNDILYGGLNKDTFVFNTTLNATTNKDIIKDFSVADDTISLENAIFKKLTTTGLLNTAYFKTTTDGKATDSNDYIVYNKTNGQLLYDADGNGAGASVLFAVVENKVALTNADFFVI